MTESGTLEGWESVGEVDDRITGGGDRDDRWITLDSREARMSVIPLLSSVGIDVSRLSKRSIDRLEMLHQHTEHFKDEMRSVEYMRRVADYLAKHDPCSAITPEEMEQIVIGTLFSDIGKTGPREASPEQLDVITAIYGVDKQVSPNESIERFIRSFFPDQADRMIRTYNGIPGLNAKMTMREFWDKHVYWSYDIIRFTGLPADGIVAAATHHLLEENIPIDIGPEGWMEAFGKRRRMGRAEVYVMLLDKYDAQIRRGGRTHNQAMEYLFGRVEHSAILDRIDSDGSLRELMYDCIENINSALTPAVADEMSKEAA